MVVKIKLLSQRNRVKEKLRSQSKKKLNKKQKK